MPWLPSSSSKILPGEKAFHQLQNNVALLDLLTELQWKNGGEQDKTDLFWLSESKKSQPS